jgi:8-oxo-dGTP diphosphatase
MLHEQYEFRFCPVCGGGLESKVLREGEPLRLVCTLCGYVHYLDPKVVACSVVELDHGIVLLRRASQPQRGKWVIPGGYVDRNEEVRAAAIRETFEETGLRTHIRGLLGVYSYPGRLAVVVVYVAGHLSGDLVVGDESEEAMLCLPEEIPWEDLAFQSTADALRDYIKMRTQKERIGHENTPQSDR